MFNLPVIYVNAIKARIRRSRARTLRFPMTGGILTIGVEFWGWKIQQNEISRERNNYILIQMTKIHKNPHVHCEITISRSVCRKNKRLKNKQKNSSLQI